MGFSVWAGNSAPAINTFISKSDFTGKSIIPFTTFGGGRRDGINGLSSKIIKKGGEIEGSFAVETEMLKDEEIAAKVKEMVVKMK